MSEQQNTSGGFARAFVPGLVLGLVVGAFVGATLPPLLAGKKLPNPPSGATGTSGPRDERPAVEREEFPAEDDMGEAPIGEGDAPPAEGVPPTEDEAGTPETETLEGGEDGDAGGEPGED